MSTQWKHRTSKLQAYKGPYEAKICFDKKFMIDEIEGMISVTD